MRELLLQGADSSLASKERPVRSRVEESQHRLRTGGNPDGSKANQGGKGRKRGAVVLPRGNLTANPHPGGHGHSSTEAAQDKRHGKRLAYTAHCGMAFWECRAARIWEPPLG